MRSSLAALLAAGVIVGLGGCSFGGDEPAERVQQPTLLSAAAVERQPPGSPARALFEWWRVMQFDDPRAGARLYAQALRITPAQLERQLAVATPAFDPRPLFVESQQRGELAIVRVLLESRARNPNGRVDVVRAPRSFELVRARGGWRLADNRYLERSVRGQRALAEALRDQARESQP
jgi:hypothetical protein